MTGLQKLECSAGSEALAGQNNDPFRDIVERHVGLVYATALRQTGSATLAEEIAQNVFLVLARKGERALKSGHTLAGWLHRTTVLESKHRLRTEFRRERREQTAASLGTAHAQDQQSLWEPLMPLLDEALLSLQESDRLAVILRFFEKKSLREVGESLGVSEDAAQKRVAKCLDELTRFFRRRGFAVPAVTVAVPLLQPTTQAAPAIVVQSVLQIVRDSAATATLGSSVGVAAITLLNMSKIQTAIICTGLAAVPVLWQWHETRTLRAEETRLAGLVDARAAETRQVTANRESKQTRLASARGAFESEQTRLSAPEDSPLAKASAADSSLWSESADYVRVPRRFLKDIHLDGAKFTNGGFRVTEAMRSMFRLTPAETTQIEETLAGAVQRIRELQTSYVVPSEAHVTSASMGYTLEKVSYRVSPFVAEGQELQDAMRASVRQVLGSERESLMWPYLKSSTKDVFLDFGANNQLITIGLTDPTKTQTPWPALLGRMYETFSDEGSRRGSGVTSVTSAEMLPAFLQPTLARWKAQVEAIRNPQ